MSENDVIRLPEVIIFAGPNGSGKSTITRMAKIGGEYINADDIKRAILCTDLVTKPALPNTFIRLRNFAR